MYVDNLCKLADAQAFTVDAVTTNSYDLGSQTPVRSLGAGEPMVMMLKVDVAADHTTGDETYQFDLIQATDAALTASVDKLVSRVIDYSLLTVGAIHFIPIPPGALTKRYVGVNFHGGGTTPTITATISLVPMSMVEELKVYAKGYTIS